MVSLHDASVISLDKDEKQVFVFHAMHFSNTLVIAFPRENSSR